MQTLTNGYLYMKDAQCAETNEKKFRFLVFELLVAKEITIRLKKIVQKWPNLQGRLGLI